MFVTFEYIKYLNMAFLNGRTVLLFIDTTTPITTDLDAVTTEDALLVACLTSNGFEGTTSAISTTSKCSGSFAESLDGEKGWTMSAEGQAISLDGVGDTRINHNALFKLWRSGVAFWAFMMDTNATVVTMRYGLARIDSFSDSAPDNEAQTFSISLTGVGQPGDQDDIAPIVP